MPPDNGFGEWSLAHGVVVVDDDRALADRLAQFLRTQGFPLTLSIAEDRLPGLRAQLIPQVIVLSRTSADARTSRTCSGLRMNGFDGGLVLVLDEASEDDVVAGLVAGADDVVPASGSPAELTARLRSLVRRIDRHFTPVSSAGPATSRLTIDAYEARYDGKAFLARGREHEVLRLLMQPPGAVVTYQRLVDEVWGVTAQISPRAIHRVVAQLRSRLRHLGTEEHIRTVRGIGVCLSSDG